MIRSSELERRSSGIPRIGDLQWGSHFCHIYRTTEELTAIIVPYLKAGLDNNETCIWVSEEREADAAKKALAEAVPDLPARERSGRIAIVSPKRWNARELDKRIDSAALRGRDGVRFACSALAREKISRSGILDVVARSNVLALFSYPGQDHLPPEATELARNHLFALVCSRGRWKIVRNPEARTFEYALRRSESKFEFLFRNMSEGFAYHRILLDREGKPCDYVFLEVNRAFEKITGLRRNGVIGKKVTEVIPRIGDDPNDWIGRYGKVALTGKAVRFESYSLRLEKWFLVSAYSPRKGYFAVMFADITERRNAREREQRLASFPQLNPNPVIELDCSGQLIFCNAAAQAVFADLGIADHEYAAFLPADMHEIVTGLRHQANPSVCREVSVKGRVFAHYINLAARFDAVRIYSMEVTEQKRAEERIIALNEELHRKVNELSAVNEELEMFSSSVSHDLRSPLRSIDGFSQEILEDYAEKLDENGVDCLRRIRSATQRMSLLIDGLLSLSRISRAEMRCGEVNLSEMARDIARELRESEPSRKAVWIIASNVSAFGDERLLYAALQNLLGNAWKFTERTKSARIEFGVRKRKGARAYFVRDNGVGFDMTFAGNLFVPFYRLHDLRDFAGNGIGLATVKRIIDRHGGTIRAEGKIGKGAVFSFTLGGDQS